MRAMGVWTARAAAVILLCACAAWAQQPEGGRKRVPQLTNDDLGASGQAGAASPAGVAMDGPLALLPPSDLVAVIDAGRIFDGVLPNLKGMAPDEIGKMMKSLDDFTAKTGIDPLKIKTVVVGIKMPDANSKSGSGAVILQGLELDPQKLAAAMKAERAELKALNHQGKPFFVMSKAKGKTPSKSGPGAGMDEVAFAPLEEQGLVIGDPGSVKNVLAIYSGSGRSESNAVLGAALKDTNPAGWVRFAANLPESFRQDLEKQGEPFRPFAAVRVVSGSLAFDADGSSAALDFKMRTSSPDEASQLQANLKKLVYLGKAFLGGDDPKMQAVNQVLDHTQIAVQGSEVSLSILLQKELLDLLKEPPKKMPTASVQ